MVGILTIGVVAALVLSIKNYYLLLLLARPVEMFEIQEFVTEVPEINDDSWFGNPLHIALSVILILLVIIIVCLFLLLLHNYNRERSRITKFRSYTEIYVALYDDSRRISLKLLTLPHTISDLLVNSKGICPRPILKRNCLKTKIKFDWSRIQITKQSDGSKISLPIKLELGFYDAYIISKILPQLSNLQLFITNGKEIHEFQNFHYAPIKPFKSVRFRNLLNNVESEDSDLDQPLPPPPDPSELQIENC